MVRFGAQFDEQTFSHINSFRLIKIKEYLNQTDPHATMIPFSGIFEHQLIKLAEDERKAYLEANSTTR